MYLWASHIRLALYFAPGRRPSLTDVCPSDAGGGVTGCEDICLVDDLEGAKQLSATQIAALTVNYDTAISERDEALRSLSLLREQREIDLQEKEELLGLNLT